MKHIPRRIFTAEFKREAIRLVTEQGLTLAEVSRKLDVATKSLRTWMNQQERGELRSSLGASKLTVDQQRIRELERELAIAKMEPDILKCVIRRHHFNFRSAIPRDNFVPVDDLLTGRHFLKSAIAARFLKYFSIGRGFCRRLLSCRPGNSWS